MSNTNAFKVLLVDKEGNALVPVVAVDNEIAADGKNPVASGTVAAMKQELVRFFEEKLAASGGESSEGIAIASQIRYAYYNGEAAQILDLSGDAPQNAGSPIPIDALLFKTGQPEPVYDAGSSMKFYIARSLQGNLEGIEITAGQPLTWYHPETGEYAPLSVIGKYRITDPNAVGTARTWECAASTALGDSISSPMIITGWNEWYEDGQHFVWRIGPKGSEHEISYWSESLDNQSPLEAAWQLSGNAGSGDGGLTFAQTPADDPYPYGPKSWVGEEIAWTTEPVLACCEAGIEACLGFWKRVDDPELVTGYTYENCNGLARLKIEETGEPRYGWEVHALDTNHNATAMAFYSTDYNQWWWGPGEAVPDPWEVQFIPDSQRYGPAIKFAYSEIGGYFPNGKLVENLVIAGQFPVVGKIYNSDATVQVRSMFPA